MKPEEVEIEAEALLQRDLENPRSTLMDSPPEPTADVSDAEVAERVKELDNGTEEEISHEEFVRRVNEERGR